MIEWHAGMELEPLVIEAVDVGGMKLVAALMNDPNPIHLDPAAAARLGLGATQINQGPITISYLQSMIARALGDAGLIRRFEARFLANVFAGDRVMCSGTVEYVDVAAASARIACNARVGDKVVVTAVVEVRLLDFTAAQRTRQHQR